MNHDAVNAVFRPALTKMETKADISARVARQIIDTEVAKRNAKTERLKAARLEMEAIAAGKPEENAVPQKKRRPSVKAK